MVPFLVIGVTCGLSAGFCPGPLMAFVISQTLRHGWREGFRSSFAPLVADPPIMIASVFLASWLARFEPVFGAISCLGGLFILYLGWECLRVPVFQVDAGGARPRSLTKAVTLHALSPAPYLFWFLVGGPQLTIAWERFGFGVIGFVVGFYGCVVGAMMLVASLAGHSRRWLNGKPYRFTMIAIGLVLIVAGVLLFAGGLRMLGLPAA